MSNPDDDTGVPSGFNDDAEMERTPPRVRTPETSVWMFPYPRGPRLGMGLAHTRAGPGGAIARSGGKVVVLCYPLFVLPASAFLLDLSISLLGYEARAGIDL